MVEVRCRARAAALLLLSACARTEVGTVAIPERKAPEIRIGVVVGAASLTLGGGSRLLLGKPESVGLTVLPAGAAALIAAGPAGLRIRLSGALLNAGADVKVTAADSGGAVRLNGRDYRGSFLLSLGGSGITAVNLLDLEEYLQGVVGAEMGRRGDAELAALKAQAVVSRGFALKAQDRWRLRGYDLLSTVADQAYAGIGFETPVSDQAVEETRGEVLTWQGQLIDGFFHSTCGGRTADGVEAFAGANRPYLRSIRDVDDAGHAWCAISPRFHWQESWSGEALARTLTETLPAAGGTLELARTLQDLRVIDRTPTGRVAHLEIRGRRSALTVTGPVARLLLKSADGSILRSANFNLQLTRSGGKLVRLDIEGSGAGHGVGMCQWGALARSRAGFSYSDILSTYFPGTQISRLY
ncbi:MAG TPA: SpoIID/LytB domain-containing protein [Gemmatimonadales bacterium]|nr:SpoIID/LytB domain-containing protein [Gemmatimonadales bacterium]